MLPASAGSGTDEDVIQIRDGASSSFRPGQAPFPPQAGGGSNAVVVQVRDSSSSRFRPRQALFPPPAGGYECNRRSGPR